MLQSAVGVRGGSNGQQQVFGRWGGWTGREGVTTSTGGGGRGGQAPGGPAGEDTGGRGIRDPASLYPMSDGSDGLRRRRTPMRRRRRRQTGGSAEFLEQQRSDGGSGGMGGQDSPIRGGSGAGRKRGLLGVSESGGEEPEELHLTEHSCDSTAEAPTNGAQWWGQQKLLTVLF